jgi:hypothetical protein
MKNSRVLKIPNDTVYKEHIDTTKPKQKDLYDIIGGLFHKNKKAETAKIKRIGSKPVYSFIPAAGYTLVSKLVISITGNAAFRTDSQANISTITGNMGYTQNRQFVLPIESEIWAKNNAFELVGDYRFYKYPQSTFGLGSNSKIANEDPLDFIYIRFYETILKHITGNLSAGAGYIIDYHTNISEKGNLNGLKPTDFDLYGKSGHSTSSGITLNAQFDRRDNSINPSSGFYSSVQYRDNFRALSDAGGWTSLVIDVRKYFKLPAGSDNIIAFWNYDWLILSGKPPYLDLPSTQWDAYSSTGRGYIQGRFRGAQEIYFESEYRFKISANGLFGGVVFGNLQSFSAALGTHLQSIQPGFGTGLRIKLNKVSKTNIDFDYGFGEQGSRGLFVNVGEVF